MSDRPFAAFVTYILDHPSDAIGLFSEKTGASLSAKMDEYGLSPEQKSAVSSLSDEACKKEWDLETARAGLMDDVPAPIFIGGVNFRFD